MRARTGRIGHAVRVSLWGLALIIIGLGLLAVGAAVPTHPLLAFAIAGAALALGLTAIRPAVLPLLAMPMVIVVARVSVGGVDVSMSDVAIFLAFWPALLLARRGYSQSMRSVIWLALVYQAATLFTVVANPYPANTVDWLHTFFLVVGGLVVGWAVGREGHARAGMSLMLLTGGGLALATVVQGASQLAAGDLGPVFLSWPFSMHKNFVGTTLASIATVAYVRPSWLGWSTRAALLLFWVCVVGVLLTQSRQGLVGLGITMLVVLLRRKPDRRRSKVMLVTIPPALALVGLTIKQQIESGNRFNSSQQRLDWLRESIGIWLQDPLFGVGLRWWYTDRFPTRFQPPNAELEVLTTTGLVGLVGFVVLMLGALRIATRTDPVFGTLALAVLLNRLVQGQLDLFWTSVGGSLPFVVIGVCLGAQAFVTEHEPGGGRLDDSQGVLETHAHRADRA